MQAADSDVFKYTIKNKGTVNGDVQDSGIQTPTYDYYTRTNDDADITQTTKLTGQNFVKDDINDLESIFLDTKMDDSTYWDKDGAIIAATFQNSEGGSNTNFILGAGTNTGSHIYQFNGFAANGTVVRFFRLNPTYTVSNNWPSGVWSETDTFTFSAGACYRIKTIGDKNRNVKATYTTKQNPYVVDKVIHYDTNNFTPGATDNGQDNPVKDTNYIWKEAYSDKVAGNNGQADDTIDGMTNTTDANGNFWLMYGTKLVDGVTTEKESSAEFIKQFKVYNDNPSVMTVTQNGTLSTPSHPTTSPAEFAAGTRLVSTYYDTDVTATDTAENDITFTTNSGGNTVYDYKNAALTIVPTVQITETFTNTVNVGAITVQKKILKPDSNPAEYLDEDTATFTFRIQLKEVFGDSTLNVGTTNSPYSGVSATKIKKDGTTDTDFNGLTEVTDSGEKYGQFTLKNGEKLTISGIPVQTKYRITETATSDSNYQQDSTTMSGFEKVTKGTLTSGISSVEGNNETIVNVRQTGTLKLKKSLGDFAAINGKTIATPFKFNVTLTVPEGVDLTDYISGLTSFDDYNHTDGTRIYSDIESDYDYVYFAAPSTWGNHIYAYFYGGGNLREDNWQRACYSIWPGVEPVGTEYKADESGTNDVEHHSDIYTYSYTGNLYSGTTSDTPTNPDSTFKWKESNTTYTVYKFRVPLGDRTNYGKVIFNNGLSKWNGGKETGVITYKSGYLYKKSGSSVKFYGRLSQRQQVQPITQMTTGVLMPVEMPCISYVRMYRTGTTVQIRS